MKSENKPRILVLHGPNFNLLALREPEIYGHGSYDHLVARCKETAADLGLEIECRQNSHEGYLVDSIHECKDKFDGLVINAGAYGHTSIALLDAIQAVGKPAVEVHISNVYKREEFRHHSMIAKAVKGVIVGFGIDGYEYALRAMAKLVTAA